MPAKQTKRSQDIESPVMRREDAAKFLKISVRALDYLVAAEEVPFRRSSKRIVLFDKDTLLDWVRGK